MEISYLLYYIITSEKSLILLQEKNVVNPL